MKFIKVVKAEELTKRYVIFENIVSENMKGYWSGKDELVDLQEADLFESIDYAKDLIQEQIEMLKNSGETAEHYFAIRPVVLEDLNAVYQTKFNEVK